MTDLVGSIVVLAGAVFLFSAGLGMFRMPDALTRIHAGAKATTLGNTLVLAGIAIYQPDWSLKLLIIVYFVLMTNPISSHALAHAAYTLRGRLASSPVAAEDDLREPERGR